MHTDKKEVLNMDRYGIEIVLKDECKKEDKAVKDILKQLDEVKENQPYLLPSTKKIVICEDVLDSAGAEESFNVKDGIYAGFADIDERTIYVSSENYIEDTVEHEMFHQFDASFGETYLSETETFYELANENYDRLVTIFGYNKYQTMDINEFFVAVALDYADELESIALKSNFPEIYDYINGYVECMTSHSRDFSHKLEA